VVQFRASARGVQPDWEGHVEHLVSGQASLFHSQEELWTFMTRMLTEVQKPSDATGGG
jgi:hypothetical protein